MNHPDPDDAHALHELLASPAIWDDPDPAIEDAVVAAIVAERDQRPIGPVDAAPHRRPRWLAAAAAVLVVAAGSVVAGVALLSGEARPPGVAVALAAVDPTRALTASAMVERTPQGVKIVLDASSLPPAEAGTYYQAWLTDGDDRVSAGTFHLREGAGTIELWCGLDDPHRSTLAVTLERMDEDAAGDVVLTGVIDG